MAASRSVARRGGVLGPARAMCSMIGRPVVAAINQAATPGPGGQVWLPRPRPCVKVGVRGPAMGCPFGVAARSASRGRAGVNGPIPGLLRK